MLNKFVFQGRLTKDPEMRANNAGRRCAVFTVACDRDFVDKTTKERATDFIDCTCWRENVVDFISRYFQKGDFITVESRMESRIYSPKEGGKRKAWEAKVEAVYFAETKASRANREEAEARRASAPKPDIFADVPSSGSSYNGFAELEDDDGMSIPF